MEIFTKEQVVPDAVAAVPAAKLTVQWDGKDLEPGSQWTPTSVKDKPKLQWQTEPGVLYMVVMVDPDIPTRADPNMRGNLHWMVINVPGCDVLKGEEWAGYLGAGCPKGSGQHRYCFFVFKQPGGGKIQITDLKKTTIHEFMPRAKFELPKFVDKYKLGTPVAGNFFLAEYDDYVPILHSQFTDTGK